MTRCVIECGGEEREFGIDLSQANVAACAEVVAAAATGGDERLELVRLLLGSDAAAYVAGLGFGEVASIYAQLAAVAGSRRAVQLAAIAKEYADAV